MNNATKYLFIFISLIGMYSCTTTNSSLQEKVPMNPGLPNVSGDIIEKGKFFIENGQQVNAVYNKTDYKAIWLNEERKLTDRGADLLQTLHKSGHYGIDSEQFNLNLIDSLIQEKDVLTDALLTDSYLKFCTQIHAGRLYMKDTIMLLNKIDSIDINLVDHLFKHMSEATISKDINSIQPTHYEYQVLSKGVYTYMESYKDDGARISIPNFKDDTMKCFQAVQRALIANHFFDSTYFVNHDSLVSALMQVQILHGMAPDGRPGRNTRQALSLSNKDRYYQAMLALEKWRSKEAYPNKYIRVNIPTYKLQLWELDTLQRVHKVVVGSRVNQTPEFVSEMKKIVAFPFWHVPYSISSKELYYKAKKDSTYLRRNGYTVFSDGNQLNSSSIDWSGISPNRFPYKVRQNGGRGNSLGLVKFLFPNEHSVYLHDTPSKRFFKNDVRAYSHGCVRLHKPIELAKFLLARDNNEIQGDTLDSLIGRRVQKHIYLKKKFPVYLEYITATADSSANIIFNLDVYGRDKKYVAVLKNTPKSLEN